MVGGVVCALLDRGLDANVAAAIAEHPKWTLVRRCVDLTEVRAVARAGTAEVAVISGEHRALDARVIEDLRSHGLRVVGVAGDENAERRLRQWRIDSVVSGDVDASAVVAALDEAAVVDLYPDARPAEAPSAATGRLLAVWGAPGAPGRSTVALNLAAEWALVGTSALLVDADDRVGSLAQMSGVLDDYAGVLAAARAANQAGLDHQSLARLAPQLDERLRILTGVTRAVRTPPPRTALEQVWSVARLIADVVVVDAGSAEADGAGLGASALAVADQVLVVGLPDPVGLARLASAVAELRDSGATADVHIAVNRLRRNQSGRSGLVRALSNWVPAEHVWHIPEDGAAADKALARGQTLAKAASRSMLRQSIQVVRAGLAGEPAKAGRRVRRGLAVVG